MVIKRLLLTGLIASLLVGAAFLQPVSAETEEVGGGQLDYIQANCVDLKYRLNQLHANDALLRVNRGQIYEAISVKLMTTMNSRIALNRLDGGGLVGITADYDQELALFRSSYSSYERQLSAALRINCDSSPDEFYEAIRTASEMRRSVHSHVVQLHDYIRGYQQEFERFHYNFKNPSNEGAL